MDHLDEARRIADGGATPGLTHALIDIAESLRVIRDNKPRASAPRRAEMPPLASAAMNIVAKLVRESAHAATETTPTTP